MKNSFTTLAAFVFGILISISIIACADNFDNEDQTAKDDLQTLIEKVTQLTEKISALENETATLKNRVSVLEESEMVESIKYLYPEGGVAEASFKYDNNGRISSIYEFNTCYGGSPKSNNLSVSYSDTGCVITSEKVNITISTKNNNKNHINRLIWSCFLSTEIYLY